jgi:hypothetical protein
MGHCVNERYHWLVSITQKVEGKRMKKRDAGKLCEIKANYNLLILHWKDGADLICGTW